MNPKLYFENAGNWSREQEDKLFVCMPFDKSLDSKFETMNSAAKKAGLQEGTERTKEIVTADFFTSSIFHGIANSKILLFDLSNDPVSEKINESVLFELGIASIIRNPENILIIREGSIDEIPSTIRASVNINTYEQSQFAKKLVKILKKALLESNFHSEIRTRSVAIAINRWCLRLMEQNASRKKGEDNFVINEKLPVELISVLRLMDLGIVKSRYNPKKREYSYYLTSFGYEVMECLGIEKQK